MGNSCRSDEQIKAIKEDGEDNVRKSAVAHGNQIFLEKHVKDLKKKYVDFIQGRAEDREAEVKQKKELLDDILEQREKELQMKESGAVEQLEVKHKQSFKELTGHGAARRKLDEFRDRSNQMHQEEWGRLKEDIEDEKNSFHRELENSKHELPALSRLGQSQRDSVLKNYTHKVNDEIRAKNEELEKEFNSHFELEEMYSKRFERKVPKSELDEIIEEFKDSLDKSTAKGTRFGCF